MKHFPKLFFDSYIPYHSNMRIIGHLKIRCYYLVHLLAGGKTFKEMEEEAQYVNSIT